MLTSRQTPPDSPGVTSLVMAYNEEVRQVRLIGLGVHFGRGIGVLPIAGETKPVVYRDLESVAVMSRSGESRSPRSAT